MKTVGQLVLLVLATCVAPLGRAADAPVFRTIRGTVLNVDGTPAANRDVSLIGLSRGSMRFHFEGTEQFEAWNFKTDERGSFVAKLGDFRTREDKAHRPGWGVYALVASAGKEDAGAVSAELVHDQDVPPANRASGDNIQVHSTLRKYLDVPPEGLDVMLQIKRGATLHGKIVDYEHPEKPMKGVIVFTNNDLHSDTHTGWGGEILPQSATSDADGEFTVEHIYPSRIYVGLGGDYGRAESQQYWLKTKAAGKWRDDVLDEIDPPLDGDVLSLEIMATDKPLFRYSGKITDSSGQPVAGAKIGFGVSFHPQVQTHTDDHNYQHVETQADGTYSVDLPTPWVRGMSVRKEGLQSVERWDEEDNISPGAYDFTLQAEHP